MTLARHAVVARRSEPADSLDYFPTPPWATRALCERLFGFGGAVSLTCREPACGEGHMAVALEEYFAHVAASDIHDYGYGALRDYCAVTAARTSVDWVITNPPFNQARAFADVARLEARVGVALLARTQWLHGQRRWRGLFAAAPPTLVLLFAERVAMVKGRWDPEASTATDYCWVVWDQHDPAPRTRLEWIAPGARERLTLRADFDRFGARRAAPLLDGGGA